MARTKFRRCALLVTAFLGFLLVPVTAADAATGPDLEPTAITFDNSALAVGNKVHFDSGVNNRGDENTGVFNIKWLVDGKEVGAYGSHDGVPKSTLVMNGNSQFDWTFDRSGSYSIAFIVDVDNHIIESNENNNSRSVTVRVTGPRTSPTPPAKPPVDIGPFEPNTDPAAFGRTLAACRLERQTSPQTVGPNCASLIAQGLGVVIRTFQPRPVE